MLIVEYITLRQGRPLQVRGSMQDLGARPLWAVVLLRHRAQSTVLYDLFDEAILTK